MALLLEFGVLLLLLGGWMLWVYWRWTVEQTRQAVEPTRETAGEAKPAAGPKISATVRDRLRHECKTSGDFEAFCLDHHPEVYKRFSSGMERVQMENLLIQHATPEEIERSLQGRSGGKLDA